MTSRLLLSKLMKENMRHRNWMIALSCFVQLMLGPIFFLFYSNARPIELYSDGVDQFYFVRNLVFGFIRGWANYAGVITAVVGAIIVATAGFMHLYSRRMTDLYNSVPVKRSTQFWVLYLNGLIIWAVPALVSHLLMLIIGMIKLSGYGLTGQLFLCVLRTFFTALFGFLSAYHVSLLAVVVCGTVINALINVALFGLEIIIGWLIFYVMAIFSFNTFVESAANPAFALGLSPLASPFGLAYYTTNTDYDLAASGSPDSRAIIILIIGLLLIAINLLLAFLSYKTRKSELAESGLTNKPLQIILLIVNSILAGVVGGEIFASIITVNKTAWALFGCVVAGVLTFGILEIIHKHQFKSFFDHKLLMTLSVAAAFGIYLIFNFDLLGYDTYLPSANSILSANIYLPGYSDDGTNLTLDENGRIVNNFMSDFEKLKQGDATALADPETIHDILEVAIQDTQDFKKNSADVFKGRQTFRIRVKKKFGGFYYRTYDLAVAHSEALKPCIETEDYMRKYYKAASGSLPMPESIRIYSLEGTGYIMTGDELKEFYDTYTYEFRGHYSLKELNSKVNLASVEFRYLMSDGKQLRYVYLSLPDNFTNSIDVLRRYHPETYWSVSDLDYVDLEFSVGIDNVFATDTLKYSYFQKEGYPSLTELQTTYRSEGRPYQYINLTLPEDYDLSGIYPYLHLGDPEGFSSDSEYVSIGNVNYDNRLVPVCIKATDMPDVYIKDMKAEMDQEDAYYDKAFPEETYEYIY